MYGDEEELGEWKELPEEYWHDKKRVDKWIEDAKQRRRDKQDQGLNS
jgi:hypothetical protein